MNHQQYEEELAKDAAYQAVRKQHKHKLPLEISAMLIKARQTKKMTQQELADKLDTAQSSVARLENGYSLPSLLFLKRIADVYETDLIPPRFNFLKQDDASSNWVVVQKEDANQETWSTTNLLQFVRVEPTSKEREYFSADNISEKVFV